MKIFAFVLLVACSYVDSAAVEQRIVNGTIAANNQFNYVVSIQQLSLLPNQLQAHRCGGVLITFRHVLTTATCVTVPVSGGGSTTITPSQYRVFAGSNLLTDDHVSDRVKTIDAITRAQDFIAAPSYQNDIAVIRLRSAYSSSIVSLASFVQSPQLLSCVLVGWGSTSVSMGYADSELRYASKTVIDQNICSVAYSGSQLISSIHNGMVCASGLNTGGCYGDGGSPLVCNGQLAGLLVLNNNCGQTSNPEVFTRVSSYYNWVRSITNNAYRAQFSIVSFLGVILTTLFAR